MKRPTSPPAPARARNDVRTGRASCRCPGVGNSSPAGRTSLLAVLALAVFSTGVAEAVDGGTENSEKTFVNRFVVKVEGGAPTAQRLAAKHGLLFHGQIGTLEGYYALSHPRVSRRSARPSHAHSALHAEPEVRWIEQQRVHKRVKRELVFNDPRWPDQWYMNKRAPVVSDMGIPGAWKMGYTGRGVVVTILDDGVEKSHPDLRENYDKDASWDVNGNDDDPTPRYEPTNFNRHGTRCAGEVAATANNNVCLVGIAYNARIGGIRMLDGDITDEVEATSLSHNPQHVDIYSSSWGPDDSGAVVDGPRPLAKIAIQEGIRQGRGGKGSLFVWANGNGGRNGDSCACDGYTNSIFTLSIAATSESGTKPWYLEECASTLASTYSSANAGHRMVISTDLHGRCTAEHTGTSAAAPLAAGIIALALEANSNLTWRDVQHIVVLTSRTEAFQDAQWTVNGVGKKVSHRYGYGMLDASAMVTLAKYWTPVPPQHTCRNQHTISARRITGASTAFEIQSNGCCGNANGYVRYAEHVVLKVSLWYKRRGDLQITLMSPMGTNSTLLPQRIADKTSGGFKGWEFMSTHYWGEDPSGTWTLVFQNKGPADNTGHIEQVELIFHGTTVCPHGTCAERRSRDSDSSTNGNKTKVTCEPLDIPQAPTSPPGGSTDVGLVLKIVVPVFVMSVIFSIIFAVAVVVFRKRLKTTSNANTQAIPAWPSQDLSRQGNHGNTDTSSNRTFSIPRATLTGNKGKSAPKTARDTCQDSENPLPPPNNAADGHSVPAQDGGNRAIAHALQQNNGAVAGTALTRQHSCDNKVTFDPTAGNKVTSSSAPKNSPSNINSPKQTPAEDSVTYLPEQGNEDRRRSKPRDPHNICDNGATLQRQDSRNSVTSYIV